MRQRGTEYKYMPAIKTLSWRCVVRPLLSAETKSLQFMRLILVFLLWSLTVIKMIAFSHLAFLCLSIGAVQFLVLLHLGGKHCSLTFPKT